MRKVKVYKGLRVIGVIRRAVLYCMVLNSQAALYKYLKWDIACTSVLLKIQVPVIGTKLGLHYFKVT